MNISNISILQWFLVIWLLTIFVKCIFEIFDKEPPSGLFFGLLLIVIGCFWFLNLKNSVALRPWIGSFYVSGLIGIILISGGIRILLKAPLRSWVAGGLIIILSISLFTYGPSRKNSSSYFDFLNNTSIHNFWDKEWLEDRDLSQLNQGGLQYFGQSGEKNLFLSFKKANVTIKNEAIQQQFGILGALTMKSIEKGRYEVDSVTSQDAEVIVNPDLQELTLRSNVGNLFGVIQYRMERIDLHTDTGNVQLSLYQPVHNVVIGAKLGNVILHIYEPAEKIEIESNIGNIEIHVKKGIRIDVDTIESRVGKTILPIEKDDSKGTCRVKVKTDIGNITLINDL